VYAPPVGTVAPCGVNLRLVATALLPERSLSRLLFYGTTASNVSFVFLSRSGRYRTPFVSLQSPRSNRHWNSSSECRDGHPRFTFFSFCLYYWCPHRVWMFGQVQVSAPWPTSFGLDSCWFTRRHDGPFSVDISRLLSGDTKLDVAFSVGWPNMFRPPPIHAR